MEAARTKNDLGVALVRFCVAIEEHRRTPEGRVRTPAQFLEHFFATANGAKDEVFRHMPKEVRGPILSGWGIRGAKAALRDEDDKVAQVVVDALAAGDLDADAFETALAPEKLLAWVPLSSFWTFWRAGAIGKPALLKAFTKAYELKLLDARAFIDDLKARGGELTATDVLGHALTKDDLIEWVRKIHTAGDGTPKGLVEALGWEKIIAKAPTESLLGALDALAVRLGIADAQLQTATAENVAVKLPPAVENGVTTGAKTPAGAEVAIETEDFGAQRRSLRTGELEGQSPSNDEDNAPKTDPPPPEEEEIEVVVPPVTDLAKTGPYAQPGPMRGARSEEEEDDSEETKLYRQRPLRR